ncbi:hypothetical protein SR39_01240 [Methylobacterium radiotolerans]|nr:hypothetical protein SR39_01240 [Methylobacterium radiotolerans]
MATLYLSDIEKTIRGRYPKGAHHADDSRRYFDAACNLMVMRFIAMKDGGRNPRKLDLFGWASRFTPALTFEQPRDWFDYVEAEIMKAFGSNALPPLLPDADEMGEMIGVTQDEFERFDLRSIGRIDNKAPQRLQTDRAKRAAREGKRRKDRGSNPHTESMAQTKPWLALDPPISRAKYYRKIGNGELPPHPSMRSVRQKRTA